MRLHETTFGYLLPTEAQKQDMAIVRTKTAELAEVIERIVPDGADKTYSLRTLRTVLMWCNVAITREGDGTPRQDL